uniref:Glycosyltransferase QUASIMODO1, putative n=1 Tax=Arundo donax TaxID=35708 RepID=A0A0A9DXZ1_ARUDO
MLFFPSSSDPSLCFTLVACGNSIITPFPLCSSGSLLCLGSPNPFALPSLLTTSLIMPPCPNRALSFPTPTGSSSSSAFRDSGSSLTTLASDFPDTLLLLAASTTCQ